MNGKSDDIRKSMVDAFEESKRFLKSISAYDYMKSAALFASELDDLINRQHLSATVIISVLMDKVYRLSSMNDYELMTSGVLDLSRTIKRYVDENFIKKEKP